MKRNYKKLLFLPFFCVVMALGHGCAKWLDVNDNDKITIDDFWQKHEDVSGAVSGAYSLLKDSWRELFLWGEMRGDAIELNVNWNDKDPATPEQWAQIKNIDIATSNPLLKYERIYAVIGACNQVIKNAPNVVFLDETLTQVQCDQYINEMKWLRSLCYFYLVRTFRDVPYVTEPTMSDVDPFAVAKTDGFEILEKLLAELKETTKPNTPGTLPPSYFNTEWEQRGRATAYAAFALMADIYLWLADSSENDYYEKAIEYCDKILNGGSPFYDLIIPETLVEEGESTEAPEVGDWFTLFAPGNTREGIFEVQFGLDQTNDLFGWTNDGTEANVRMLVTQFATNSFKEYDEPAAENAAYLTGVVDLRGESASFIGKKNWLWKYAGGKRSDNVDGGGARGDKERNANIIIYRLADIYLMKAEALIMQGSLDEALELINLIRKRAGYTDESNQNPTVIPSKEDGLELLMEERQREFLGEGKRWFDIARLGIRENGQYREMAIALVSRQIPVATRETFKEKLRDPDFYSFFLPISQEEIDAAGGVLIQNPFYR